MSIRAIDWAFRQEIDSPTTKFVLVKLADNANDDGECWPAQSTIAKHTGLARETVNRHVKTLEELGKLTIEHRDVGKGKIANVYHLPIQADHVTVDHMGCDPRSHGGVTDDHTNRKVVTVNEPKPRFVPPAFSDVVSYCRELNIPNQADDFYDYYESVGWQVGRKPMRDWKACARRWARKTKQEYPYDPNNPPSYKPK